MMHPVATGQDAVADPLEKLIILRGGGGGGGWKWQNTLIGIPHKKNYHMAMSDPWIRLASNLMYHGMDRAGR